MRLGDIVEIAFRQLGALVQEVDLVLGRLGALHALAVIPIEILETMRVVQRALNQVGGFGVARNGGQGLAQRGDRVLDVAGFVPAAGDLKEDRGRPIGAVGADPVRVGVHRRQQVERFFVPRPQPDDLAQTLRGCIQLLQLLGEHPPQAQQQIGAALGIGGSGQLQFVEAHHAAIVAERAINLARRFD